MVILTEILPGRRPNIRACSQEAKPWLDISQPSQHYDSVRGCATFCKFSTSLFS